MTRFPSITAFCILVTLNCSGAWSQIVEFRLEVTDLAGTPVSTLGVGDDFLLSAFTSHVSGFADPADAGVFSAYLDVSYDGALASTTGPIDHSLRFSTVSDGDLTPGFIDNVGGLATDPGNVPTPNGPMEEQVFSLPLRADAAGTLDFIGSPSGDNVFFPILVFGLNTTIDPADVSYGSTSVSICLLYTSDAADE